jgi:hypothetical protein
LPLVNNDPEFSAPVVWIVPVPAFNDVTVAAPDVNDPTVAAPDVVIAPVPALRDATVAVPEVVKLAASNVVIVAFPVVFNVATLAVPAFMVPAVLMPPSVAIPVVVSVPELTAPEVVIDPVPAVSDATVVAPEVRVPPTTALPVVAKVLELTLPAFTGPVVVTAPDPVFTDDAAKWPVTVAFPATANVPPTAALPDVVRVAPDKGPAVAMAPVPAFSDATVVEPAVVVPALSVDTVVAPADKVPATTAFPVVCSDPPFNGPPVVIAPVPAFKDAAPTTPVAAMVPTAKEVPVMAPLVSAFTDAVPTVVMAVALMDPALMDPDTVMLAAPTDPVVLMFPDPKTTAPAVKVPVTAAFPVATNVPARTSPALRDSTVATPASSVPVFTCVALTLPVVPMSPEAFKDCTKRGGVPGLDCVMESRISMDVVSMTLVGPRGLAVGCVSLHTRTSVCAVASQNWYRNNCGIASCTSSRKKCFNKLGYSILPPLRYRNKCKLQPTTHSLDTHSIYMWDPGGYLGTMDDRMVHNARIDGKMNACVEVPPPTIPLSAALRRTVGNTSSVVITLSKSASVNTYRFSSS